MAEALSEVSISRWFDAPPELVWRAFVDPVQLGQWFGPLMFTVPTDTISVDARPGGHWALTMVGKDDTQWRSPIRMTLTEVVEHQLLVGYQVAEGVPGLEDGTHLTFSIELRAEGGGTRLQLRQGPLPDSTHETATVGWSQSFFKLDALLATPAKFRGPSDPEGKSS